MIGNAEYAVRQKNTQKILLWDAQYLHRLNTLLDTIRWLVISTGQYVSIQGYRLLTGTMNIYLERS
jgi:hypothetical protein